MCNQNVRQAQGGLSCSVSRLSNNGNSHARHLEAGRKTAKWSRNIAGSHLPLSFEQLLIISDTGTIPISPEHRLWPRPLGGGPDLNCSQARGSSLSRCVQRVVKDWRGAARNPCASTAQLGGLWGQKAWGPRSDVAAHLGTKGPEVQNFLKHLFFHC